MDEDIVCKITQRNNIRRANTCDPALKLLNEEITSDIQKHKQNIWKEHLDAHWDHRHNTHTLWKTIHGLSNRAPPHTLNTSITFNNKTVRVYANPNMEIINPSDNVLDLGIFMSSNCSFEFHIQNLCKKCSNLSGWILRTFTTRYSITMMTLFKSLVLPRLDYGS